MKSRAIVSDNGGRFIDAPDKFDFHEYRQMELFIASLTARGAAAQLSEAIRGSGAFRMFRSTLRRLGLEDRWYRYRAEAMKQFVIEWAEANHVTWEDDLKPVKE